MKIDEIKHEIDNIAATSSSIEELRSRMCTTLNRKMPNYNWVGFYMIDKAEPRFLDLEEFVGAMTPHTRIALDQGICGAAVSEGKIIIVPDVTKDLRYLSCSLETKSEIVVPVFGSDNTVLGELDIDSHRLDAFKEEDVDLLKHCAYVVGQFMEREKKGAASSTPLPPGSPSVAK